MKFKMAKQSLFAILLRSPWWISMGIALVFGGASRALLPDAYWQFGAMGGLPFLAIGCIRLWRQLRAPSSQRLATIESAVAAMSWREFEQALQRAYEQDGYTVRRSQGAADLAITREGRTTLVAARRWKAAAHGEEGLQALRSAMDAQGASGCLYITLGQLSAKAQRYAQAQSVQVMQGAALALLLRDLPA